MRILLTGMSGQVGGALVPRLQGFGQVIAPDETEFDLTQPVEISRILDRANPGPHHQSGRLHGCR